MLAIRILQQQDIEVEALNFRTIFTCCQDDAGRAARELGVRLTVVGQEDDYLDLVRRPKFGYGRGANPCVDCRIYMFRRARRFMEQVDASMVVSGEVVGQRPMSQKRRDLDVIAHHADLGDRLLRPLSAKLLPPTLPEREGVVDRRRLFGFSGRSRKALIALAHRLGLASIPPPSTGCALTEPQFALKVFDLLHHAPGGRRWDFELLKTGRHHRMNASTKVIVGRGAADNRLLDGFFRQGDAAPAALLSPENFAGPTALLIGPVTDESLDFAGQLILRYSKVYDADDARLVVEHCGTVRRRLAQPSPHAASLPTLTAGGAQRLHQLRRGVVR